MIWTGTHTLDWLRRSARRAVSQDGDTLIEVVMAAFLGVIVISGLVLTFAHGDDSSLGAQRETALIEAANQQIETIRQVVKVDGFSALALKSAPAAGSSASVKYDTTTPLDPNSFVTTCGSTQAYQIENNYDNTGQGLVSSLPVESPCTTAGLEPLLTGGLVTQQVSIAGTASSLPITLDAYVTATSVGCNLTLNPGTTCADDARRVVVAAVDTQAAANCSSAASTVNRCAIGADAPVYLTTIFTNPVPTNAPNSSVGITLGVQLG